MWWDGGGRGGVVGLVGMCPPRSHATSQPGHVPPCHMSPSWHGHVLPCHMPPSMEVSPHATSPSWHGHVPSIPHVTIHGHVLLGHISPPWHGRVPPCHMDMSSWATCEHPWTQPPTPYVTVLARTCPPKATCPPRVVSPPCPCPPRVPCHPPGLGQGGGAKAPSGRGHGQQEPLGGATAGPSGHVRREGEAAVRRRHGGPVR